MRAISKEAWVTLALCGLMVGCGTTSVYQQIRAEDPSQRIEAIVRAGNQKDTQALVHLVERLSDVEPAVRLAAAVALEKITGRTMGYEYYAPVEQRDRAIERWREYLRQRRGEPTSTSLPARP